MRSAAFAGVVVLTVLGGAAYPVAAECVLPTVGGGFGSPERLSAFLEAGCELYGEKLLLAFGARAGIGGGELSAGVGRYLGPGAVNLRAAIMRTWGSPLGFAPGETVGGVRLEYSLLLGALSAKVGVMTPLSGGRPGATGFVWGVSVGIPLGLRVDLGRIET